MKCPHYKFCISNKLLCFDNKCSLNIKEKNKEEEKRIDELIKILDSHKNEKGEWIW